MARTDRTAIALQIHKGAIKLIESGKFTNGAALRESIEMMQEIFQREADLKSE